MRKRSKSILLVSLPLAATLAACGSEDPKKTGAKYDQYSSIEDCAKDWDVAACELKGHPETGQLVWVGPPYKDNNKPSYVDQAGNNVERRSSGGAVFYPIFIPHASPPAYVPSAPQGPARAFVAPPIAKPQTPTNVSPPRTSVPSVSAPAVASRGGFGSTSSSVGASSSGG